MAKNEPVKETVAVEQNPEWKDARGNVLRVGDFVQYKARIAALNADGTVQLEGIWQRPGPGAHRFGMPTKQIIKSDGPSEPDGLHFV